MKLETTITQPLSVPMALMPQLTLPEVPPLFTAPLTSIPALSVTETAPITPLRQAFFTAPVASDFETNTASVSLPQQFELAQTRPLLAFAAIELARLSESAQTVSSFVFAKPAVVSGMEPPSPVTVNTNVAVENILQVPSLSGVNTPIKNVVRTEAIVEKADGRFLIENVARAESTVKIVSPDFSEITKSLSLRTLHQQSEAISQVQQGDRRALRARDDSAVISTDELKSLSLRTLPQQGEAISQVQRGDRHALRVRDDSAVISTGESKSLSLRTLPQQSEAISQAQPEDRHALRARDDSGMNGAPSIKIKGELRLAKFGPRAPVGPGVPIMLRGLFTTDLRAISLPLEDRKAAAKGASRNQAVAKIDEMSADADSQGSQSQNSEPQQ